MKKENKNVEFINKTLGVDESFQTPEKIMEILFNKEEREEIFLKFLEHYDYNVGYDWFNEYFQEEHADRKKKKQDFTPKSVCQLLSEITLSDFNKNDGLYYECCAGTGSILINYWDNFRRKFSPFNYKPSFQYSVVEELSDRCIPFLLFNMMIRGINGVVIHGDCLTRKCKDVYLITNEKDDHLTFSDIQKLPHTKQFEKLFNVKFEVK